MSDHTKTDENICPYCKSENIEHRVQRHNNGILGTGYNSRIVNEYWFCRDCGIMFQKIHVRS